MPATALQKLMVKIAQTAVSNPDSLQARGLITEADMNQFIRRRNVERYWRLLDCLSDDSDRQTILQLLVEERQKQKDAGDVFIR